MFARRVFCFILFSVLTASSLSTAVLRWDWDRIDTSVENLYFPQDFLFGVATSSYQVEGGCTNNQWVAHECKTRDKKGRLRMPEPSGVACDHWNRYEEDVQLIKNVNANAYRFSVEWSKIEPREGQFNEEALQHYADVCDELLRNGIKPILTIHHYTEPIWFFERGSFEKEENIKYYVRFAEKLFERLGNRVHLWITFSSPIGYSMKGYCTGEQPPYKKNTQLATEVLKNLLEAHVQAYKKMKSLPGGQDAQIGISKTIYQLDPVNSWDVLAKLYTSIANKLKDKPIYEFFTTGTFKVKIPFMVNVKHVNECAPKSLDFIALSYYSHGGVKGFKTCRYPGEAGVRKANQTLYAEGLYRALEELSENVAEKLHIPIYITENGYAFPEIDMRDLFLKRYLYAVSEAIKAGIDVRGYVYWSLMDNYEWGSYDDRYGLYWVDFKNGTLERTLKPSAQHFIDVAGRFASC